MVVWLYICLTFSLRRIAPINLCIINFIIIFKSNFIFVLDKCDNDISTATIGEPICIPFTQKLTGYPSRVHVRQKSSQYCIELQQGFSVIVSSDNFVRQIGDWIIYFNSSSYQQFRFVKTTATCNSIGIYELALFNGVDNLTPFEFTIRLKGIYTSNNDNQ